MKKGIVLMAVLAVVGVASASLLTPAAGPRTIFQDGVNARVSSVPIGASTGGARVGEPNQYSNMVTSGASNYAYTIDPNGIADDYVSVAAAPFTLASFRFAGGITTAGTTLYFDFYDAAQNHVSYFGINLSQTGNYIWTITIDPNNPVTVPNAGYCLMSTASSSNARWFANSLAPTIGTTTSFPGATQGGVPVNFKFELNGIVPEPASLALLALGMLIRRR